MDEDNATVEENLMLSIVNYKKSHDNKTTLKSIIYLSLKVKYIIPQFFVKH
jgi:hypothetical protein